jgi:hypothetical protein
MDGDLQFVVCIYPAMDLGFLSHGIPFRLTIASLDAINATLHGVPTTLYRSHGTGDMWKANERIRHREISSNGMVVALVRHNTPKITSS